MFLVKEAEGRGGGGISRSRRENIAIARSAFATRGNSVVVYITYCSDVCTYGSLSTISVVDISTEKKVLVTCIYCAASKGMSINIRLLVRKATGAYTEEIPFTPDVYFMIWEL